MKTLVQLTNLLSQVASLPEDRSEAHPLVLDAVVRAVAESSRAWLGIKLRDRWHQTAGEGELCLDPESGGSVRTDGRLVVGRFDTESGVRIAMQIEVLYPTDVASVKTGLKVGLDVVAAYEAVREARLQARSSHEQTQQLLDLVAALSNNLYSDETFYSELLGAAMSMIPEAECGSIAQLKDGAWRFVAARGHKSELLELSLPPGALGIHPEPVIIQNLLSRDPGVIDGVAGVLGPVSRTMVKTMIVTLEVGSEHWVNVALDIPAGSRHRFSASSLELFSRLTGLVKSFLAFRSQKAAAEWANRRLTEKLALLAEAHDFGTAEHNSRVAAISARLAADLGLNDDQIEAIRGGAALHDVGKLFLDPRLLNKTGPLSAEERLLVRQHTVWAEKLFDDPYFTVDQKIAVFHHERFDGQGYPKGLKGNEIPIEAQIVSVADVYDALRSTRSYKGAYTTEEALQRMYQGDERTPPGAFNPTILEVLRACAAELEPLWAAKPTEL